MSRKEHGLQEMGHPRRAKGISRMLVKRGPSLGQAEQETSPSWNKTIEAMSSGRWNQKIYGYFGGDGDKRSG